VEKRRETYIPSSRKRLMFHMVRRAVGEEETMMIGCEFSEGEEED
jgi:hypothetical protein